MILQIDVTVTGAGGQVAVGSVAVDVNEPPPSPPGESATAAMQQRSRALWSARWT